LELKIEKLVYGGDGLARLPADEHGRGKAVFVPFVLEGETVEAQIIQQKPGFARARVERVVEASPHRVSAGCPYFAQCGGCHYQHASYEHQLEIKAAILKENLRRIAKLELDGDIVVHPSPPWNYRNRTRLRVRGGPGFALGYFRFGSHNLLPVRECPISSPLINRAIEALWGMGQAGGADPSITEIELFANHDDSQLMVEAFCEKCDSHKDRNPASRSDQSLNACAEGLAHLLPEVGGVAVFPQSRPDLPPSAEPEPIVSVGSRHLKYETAQAAYRVSAGSFFQVNRHLIDELVGIVTQGRSGGTALDLYAGVGLFSAVLSREFEYVIAVEASPKSAADLKYNVPANVKPVRATVEQHLRNLAEKPDLVVVDPPRSGLGEKLAHSVAELQAGAISYVSCDPATLARDLVPLRAAGYRVQQAHLVDLFPQTFHLETVMQLVR
jgi:23S rRNA (uracil1939-C5)-methyltransferase